MIPGIHFQITWLQGISFVAGTLFIIWFSWWASIKDGRYHGYYRFFSFESLLLLVLIQWHAWFAHPLAYYQLLSWFFLTCSLVLAIYGFLWLIRAGKPNGKFENTSKVITSGAYRYIRHPLYASLLLAGFGAWLKNPFPPAPLMLMLANTLALFFTARADENEMKGRFGEEYIGYMKRTKMFIPFIF